MDAMESCVPPGFRFHPTDEELVGYYLKKKVASKKIDLDVIKDIDLYRIEPWDLQEKCRIGYEEQNEWYFFSHKDKKYPTGTRTNRATLSGFWKATGRDKAVHDRNKLVGMRKTLVFYKGRAPNGQKTDWIMHEYRLESEENAAPQEEGWVVCRAFKKRTPNCQMRAMEAWDPSSLCYVDDPSPSASLLDPVDLPLLRPPPPPNSIFPYCKQEPPDNLAFLASTNYRYYFLHHLSHLDSPSLPPPAKRLHLSSPTDSTTTSTTTTKPMKPSCTGVVTDWRALDRFVASQLSPEDHPIDRTDFAVPSDGDISELLLHHQGINGALVGEDQNNSTCDIGICKLGK